MLLLVSLPNVTETSLSDEHLGQPLLLHCSVTTVRGITSSVDIVWIADGKEVRRARNVSGEIVGISVVYGDTYHTPALTEKEINNTYQCNAAIGDNISMSVGYYHVIGKFYMHPYIYPYTCMHARMHSHTHAPTPGVYLGLFKRGFSSE